MKVRKRVPYSRLWAALQEEGERGGEKGDGWSSREGWQGRPGLVVPA